MIVQINITCTIKSFMVEFVGFTKKYLQLNFKSYVLSKNQKIKNENEKLEVALKIGKYFRP